MHSDQQSHYARLSDGKSAVARDCQVRLDLTGLDIASDDGAVRMRWPYESLGASEPIRAHAIDVLLSSDTEPGATLFVPGPDFAKALAPRAPNLTHRSQGWRHVRPWLIGAGAIAALSALVHFAQWTPLHALANVLPHSWRDRLGEVAIDQMAENRQRCVNPVGLAALDTLTKRLSTAAGTGQPFRVIVVDWDLFNAFAVPGEQIIMTRGMIEKADSPDEVAGVLAHEMGHGIALHPETGIIRAVGMSAAVELMMGGSGGGLANLGLVLAQLGYTRAAEREADDLALKLLRTSAISQQGLASFFQRVLTDEDVQDPPHKSDTAGIPTGREKETGREKDGPQKAETKRKFERTLDMFSTHPPTEERAKLIRLSPSYPSTPALSAEEWRAFKSICATTAPRTPQADDAVRP